MSGRVRDYREVVRRLTDAAKAGWRLQEAGKVWGYPWFIAERVVRRAAPTVLLSGGMHGEEPGGVEGVLRWLEGGEWARWRVNWLVFPCINPYGWERNQRTNAQRRDVNRQFRARTDTPESELIKRLVWGRRFGFSMEFHEDVDASGYYLYELRREPPFIGEKILRAVAKVIRINRETVIDGNRATGRGLIRRDANGNLMRTRRRWPMAFHLYQRCTDHILGSETPVRISLARRAAAHGTALKTALAAHA
ncbi:MAG TPA: M14 family metallocarboxypeptidase [Verrucomicrobiae bacterium]|nr:M14 family metallocarboxypeptidase [Verrucomicrobiae bacterium]